MTKINIARLKIS